MASPRFHGHKQPGYNGNPTHWAQFEGEVLVFVEDEELEKENHLFLLMDCLQESSEFQTQNATHFANCCICALPCWLLLTTAGCC